MASSATGNEPELGLPDLVELGLFRQLECSLPTSEPQ
jgi:hypothetical protein